MADGQSLEKKREYRDFAKKNGYPVPMDATPADAFLITEFWQGEIEERVADRDSYYRDLVEIQQKIEEVEKAIQNARFLHDSAAATVIESMIGTMDPTKQKNLLDQLNDPFKGEDE